MRAGAVAASTFAMYESPRLCGLVSKLTVEYAVLPFLETEPWLSGSETARTWGRAWRLERVCSSAVRWALTEPPWSTKTTWPLWPPAVLSWARSRSSPCWAVLPGIVSVSL